MKISELGLPKRYQENFLRAGIETVEDLLDIIDKIKADPNQISRLKGIGVKTLESVIEKLKEFNKKEQNKNGDKTG